MYIFFFLINIFKWQMHGAGLHFTGTRLEETLSFSEEWPFLGRLGIKCFRFPLVTGYLKTVISLSRIS